MPYFKFFLYLQLEDFPTHPGDKICIQFSGDGAKLSRTSTIIILSFTILVPQSGYLSGSGSIVELDMLLSWVYISTYAILNAA